MASALMRRSVLTAAVAAIATVASPLATNAFAVAPALTAPTFTPANGATVTANQPPISVAYNTPLNTGASSLTVTDTSASNAPVTCPVTFTNLNQTMQCTPSQSLVDGHVYKVAAHAENLDSSSKRDDSATWTVDIPSFVSSSPVDGSTVGLISSVAMTFDEWIDSSHFSASLVKNLSDGSTTNVPAKSVSASNNAINANPKRGTLTFTALNTLSTGNYTATFTVSGVDASIPLQPKYNPNATGTHTIDFSVDAGMPIAPPSNTSGPSEITGSNQHAVPFSGYAPLGANVKVIIYDEETDSSSNPKKTEGTGPNDVSATTVAPTDCTNPQTVNGVDECPWSLTVDASKMPDTDPNDIQASVDYQWYALTFTAAGQLPSKACPTTVTNGCTADPIIDKDTTGPSTPPAVGDAYVTNNPNAGTSTVNIENISDSDPDVASYILTATDTNGHSKSVPQSGGSGPSHSVGTASFTVDSSLDDGPLTVTVTTVDVWGNPGASTDANVKSPTISGTPPNTTTTTYSLTKESTATAPVLPATADTLTASGRSIGFTTLNGQSRIQTPTAASVVFDEPIRLTATDTTSTASPQPTLFESKLCFNDVTADVPCVNYHSGTLTIAPNSDNRTLVWTAPAGFSLGGRGSEGHTFTVTAVALAATCPDKTPQNSQSYSCERSADPGPTLASFILDNTAPSVHVLTVNGAPVANSSIDATNITNTVISGTTDADTSSVTLVLKSSGGSNNYIVPASSITITPSNGSVSSWQTAPLNLTTLQDGTITITASGSDGANSSPIDPAAPNPDGTSRLSTTSMQARPSAPQNVFAAGGNNRAVIVWSAPATNGGHSLTGYTLTVTDTSVPGSTPTAVNPAPTATATSYTVNGLTNGHTYSLALSAANDIGNGPAVTKSVTPKGNTAMSLTGPAHGIITYGQSFGLGGNLTYAGIGVANEPVTVTSKYYNGANGPTYHTTTDQNGHWAIFGLKPAKNIRYTATFGGDGAYNGSSHSSWVLVRALVKLTKVTAASRSHTSPVTLSGSVAPNLRGYRVYIYEVRSNGSLVKLGSAKLSSKSTWSFVHTFSKGKHFVIAKFFTHAGNQTNQTGRVKVVRT